jgi:putative tricarboxylic transport membrane protein
MAGVLAGALAGPALAAPAEFSIMAPAAPGGGWDQTARSIQAVLQETGLVKSVQVVNVPGAGGAIGLAQFLTQSKGDPTKLMVTGYVMVGALVAAASPVKLSDVTPIARLTSEYDAIVVPANSPIKTMADLVAKLKENPGSVSWAGGSAGGVDHIAAGLIAKAAGVDPTKVNYIAFSGGGEALASVLGGKVTVGISGYSEFEGQIKGGALRLIAMTGGKSAPNAPTLKDAGLDVDVQNWRMIAAAPGITAAQKAEIGATIEQMAKSDAWKKMLASKGWEDTYLAGEPFTAFLNKEITDTTGVLKTLGIAK